MKNVKKTKTIQQMRKSEAAALISERNIVTTYYTDSTRAFATKVNRAKNASRAVMLATGHMRDNDYEALVCEVWDENLNEVLTVIVRDVTGALSVMDYYDTATGQPIKEQPWKKKLQKHFPNLFIREDDGKERNLTLEEFRGVYHAFMLHA